MNVKIFFSFLQYKYASVKMSQSRGRVPMELQLIQIQQRHFLIKYTTVLV